MSETQETLEAKEAQEETGRSTTRDALLDAGELLFANDGIQGTSLRAITSKAGANLAAVNYHFGNKDGLVRAVFERRIGPVNEERLRLLDEIEGSAGDSADLDAVLRAFVAPVLSMGAQGDTAHFKRLMGRIFTESGEEMRSLVKGQFEDVSRQFGAAIARSLPNLSREVLLWRFHFMLGSMLQVAHNGALIVAHSGGICDPSRTEEVIVRMVEFVAAGFRAPVAEVQPHRVEKHRVDPALAEPALAETSLAETSSPPPTERKPRETPEGIFAWEDGF